MSRRKLDNGFHLFAGAVVQMKTSDILVWHDSKYAAVSYAYTVGTLDVDDFLRFAIHDVLVVWNVRHSHWTTGAIDPAHEDQCSEQQLQR